MKLSRHGKSISEAEVADISPHGVWLNTQGSEYFLPYEEYPWFKDAKVLDIFNVQLLHGDHLHWPVLDVDLEIDSLKHPEKYPLLYK